MAGFGSGRSCNRSSSSSSRSSSGFGSGRSYDRSDSSSNGNFGNTNFSYVNLSGSGYSGYRRHSFVSLIGSLTFTIVFLAIGLFAFFGSSLSYAKVQAVITAVEEKEDKYGTYYDYDIEYEYENKVITSQWEDDYFQDVGYEFKIYVEKDNPAKFQFERPGGARLLFFGGIFTFVGGMSFISTVTTFIFIVIEKKKENEDDFFDESWS